MGCLHHMRSKPWQDFVCGAQSGGCWLEYCEIWWNIGAHKTNVDSLVVDWVGETLTALLNSIRWKPLKTFICNNVHHSSKGNETHNSRENMTYITKFNHAQTRGERATQVDVEIWGNQFCSLLKFMSVCQCGNTKKKKIKECDLPPPPSKKMPGGDQNSLRPLGRWPKLTLYLLLIQLKITFSLNLKVGVFLEKKRGKQNLVFNYRKKW